MFAAFCQGANQAELARQLGTSREMVRRLASGLNGPGIEMACRIERITYGKVPLRAWITEAKGSSAA